MGEGLRRAAAGAKATQVKVVKAKPRAEIPESRTIKVLITGPKQSGKTTALGMIGRSLMELGFDVDYRDEGSKIFTSTAGPGNVYKAIVEVKGSGKPKAKRKINQEL